MSEKNLEIVRRAMDLFRKLDLESEGAAIGEDELTAAAEIFHPDSELDASRAPIAQFMPGTAASYGLRNPFDPVAAIDAQAHLMSDLLRQFHSVPLALAAYNAGPGAVGSCGCIPYSETRAYVARILALADGTGVLLSPPLEVRLVK